MNREGIELRPHHLLCLLAFIGRGYSPAFITRMRELQLEYFDPVTMVRLVDGPDDACGACPELEVEGCGLYRNVGELDRRVLEATGLAPGIHNAAALHRTLARTIQTIPPEELCGDCDWREQVDCPTLIRRRLEALTTRTEHHPR